jgi:hypothetical protein
VIDEQDLYDLAHEPLSAGGQCRSVGDVLTRGHSLRRRRKAMRDFGLASVVGGLVAAGTVALRADDGTDVTTVNPSSTASDDPPGDGTPPEDGKTFEGSELDSCPDVQTQLDLTTADADGVRYLPSWLPEGVTLQELGGIHIEGPCPEDEPMMVLQSDGGDDTVDATIRLSRALLPGPPQTDARPTTVRGGPAMVAVHDSPPAVTFYWTDSSQEMFILDGSGVDEATLRSVADALDYSSTPEAGEPVTYLPPEARPDGFEMIWDVGSGALEPPPTEILTADLSNDCAVTLRSDGLGAPLGLDLPNFTRDAVGEHPAVFGTSPTGGLNLQWEQADGVVGYVWCQDADAMDEATAVRIAESMEAVAANDPRLGG